MSLLTKPRPAPKAPRVLTRLQTEALAGAMSALAILDEVMKDFLWRCRAELAQAGPDVTFLPRPPELISLAELVRKGVTSGTIVYPDPPLGARAL